MPENNFVKNMAHYQNNLDKIEKNREAYDSIWKAQEKLLNIILLELSPTDAQLLQESFEEYKTVYHNLMEEIGPDMGLNDIKKIIPDNLWIKVFTDYVRDLKKTPEDD